MTADLLRRQLQATADAVPDSHALKLLVHGAQTALHRALVIGAEAALLELDAELSDAATVRACRSALQQAADRILATARTLPACLSESERISTVLAARNAGVPDPDDEGTRMAVER